MRLISVDKLRVGMKMARSVYNSEGSILLSAGIKLKDSYIKRLRDVGVEAVYIHPEGMPEMDIPDPLSDKTRVEVITVIKGKMDSIATENSPSFDKVRALVNKIIDEVLVDDTKVIHLNDIRSLDTKIFNHSVNVSLFSILIAFEVGYNIAEMQNVALGSLFHDVGLIMVDKKIVDKEGQLNREEQEDFEKHSYYGYQIMKDIDKFNVMILEGIYQHHEKLDGSGYPKGLKGDEIIDFAQILGVANLYDVLTNEGLSGDGGSENILLPHQALNLMGAIKGSKLNADYVDALSNHIASYPIGSMVILSNGQTGLVVDVNSEDSIFPVVKIIKDSAGKRVKGHKLVDLGEVKDLKIKEVKRFT